MIQERGNLGANSKNFRWQNLHRFWVPFFTMDHKSMFWISNHLLIHTHGTLWYLLSSIGLWSNSGHLGAIYVPFLHENWPCKNGTHFALLWFRVFWVVLLCHLESSWFPESSRIPWYWVSGWFCDRFYKVPFLHTSYCKNMFVMFLAVFGNFMWTYVDGLATLWYSNHRSTL